MGDDLGILNPPATRPQLRDEDDGDTEMSTRTMPHDFSAERAVLGGIMLDANAMALVAPILRDEDFYHPAHAIIFNAMGSIASHGDPIDSITIASELRARERLNTVGGPQYLGDLTDATPTSAHIERHARIVSDLAQVRRVITAAGEIAAAGFDRPRDLAKYLGDASHKIMTATERRGTNEPRPIEHFIQRMFERIEAALDKGQRTIGLVTSFDELDSLTGGMFGGQLIIIAGRPGMGKSALALNIAENVAMAKAAGSSPRHVLFFTLEMPGDEFAARSMSGEARVDQSRLRTSMLSQDDMTALTHAASRLFNAPIAVDESGSVNVMDIRAKAMRAKQRGELDLIVIDYLQLMDHGDAERRDAAIGNTTRALKRLAKQLDVPIVALSQLNRAPETRPGKDRRPQLSDLRESGDIEQDADVVLFVFRPEVYDRKDPALRGVAEVIIAKQRNGPTDTVRLRFVKELARFENIERDDAAGPQPTHWSDDE